MLTQPVPPETNGCIIMSVVVSRCTVLGTQLERAGQHSVWINGQWHICFFWTAIGLTDVEIVDYH